jgi:hypothetical protein
MLFSFFSGLHKFVHHVLPFYVFILQEFGSVNELRSGIGSSKKDKMIIFRVVTPPGSRTSPSTNWSERSVLIPARCSLCHFTNQLVGLLGAHRPVILTSCLGFFVSFVGVLAS